MTFTELPPLFPAGVIAWGAEDGERSYVITFDRKAPHMGYRASWKTFSGEQVTEHLPEGFASLKDAKRALIRIAKSKAH